MKVLVATFLQGPNAGTSAVISAREAVLGRSDDVDICVADPLVSSRHVRIRLLEEERIEVQDLGSRHGTFVAANRVDATAVVAPGQEVTIGGSVFTLQVKEVSHAALGETVHGQDRQWRFETLLEKLQAGEIAQHKIAGFVRVLFELGRVTLPSPEHTAEILLDSLAGALEFHRALVVVPHAEEETRILASRIVGDEGQRAPSQTILSRVLREGVSILALDARTDERFSESRSISEASIRSVLCAPIVHEHVRLGAIYVDHRGSANIYTDEDLAFLEAAGSMMATLLENRMLLQRVWRTEQLSAIGTVVAQIMHDIRSPLFTISLLTQSLANKDIAKAWPAASKRILGAVDLISNIINGALAVAKGGEQPLESVDINSVLGSAIALTKPGFKHRIELTTEFGRVAPIRARSTRLVQVFLNLLRNAADAIDGQGSIVVCSEPIPGGVRVKITDSGRGMSRAVLAKAFAPFFTTSRAGGTGLGLAVCREIVEEHKGRIGVESQPLRGAIVTVELPADPEADRSEP